MVVGHVVRGRARAAARPAAVHAGSAAFENPVGSYLFVLWGLATLVGSLALGAVGSTTRTAPGFWQFLHVVVGLGSLVLLVLFLLPSNPKGARFDV